MAAPAGWHDAEASRLAAQWGAVIGTEFVADLGVGWRFMQRSVAPTAAQAADI